MAPGAVTGLRQPDNDISSAAEVQGSLSNGVQTPRSAQGMQAARSYDNSLTSSTIVAAHLLGAGRQRRQWWGMVGALLLPELSGLQAPVGPLLHAGDPLGEVAGASHPPPARTGKLVCGLLLESTPAAAAKLCLHGHLVLQHIPHLAAWSHLLCQTAKPMRSGAQA